MRPGPSCSPGSMSSSPVTSRATWAAGRMQAGRVRRRRQRPARPARPRSAPERRSPRRGRPRRRAAGCRRPQTPPPAPGRRRARCARPPPRPWSRRGAPRPSTRENRGPRPQPSRRRPPGPRLVDHLQVCRAARDHGVAVHRGVVEGRDVDRALDFLGQHAAEGCAEGDLLEAEPGDGAKHPARGPLDRDQVAHAPNLRREKAGPPPPFLSAPPPFLRGEYVNDAAA